MTKAWTPGYRGVARSLAKIILRRDRLCVVCHDAQAVQVDHLVPRSQGGTDDPANLRGVCEACHTEKTKRESREGRDRRHALRRHPPELHPGTVPPAR